MRWPIETISEEAKGEVGFDHYEMRSWLGWHHHMLFVLLLIAVLPKRLFDATAAL